jgi:8-oxo-dGTP diphosphatase
VTAPGPVRAAGAVLWRPGPRPGTPLIALVHRPRYDDWTLPKGKLKRDEDFPAAALREVKEETGMDCELGRALPPVHYRVGDRWKVVRYWVARATAGAFESNDEVDRLLWLEPADARSGLTYRHDRPLVDAALTALARP